jgi:uncharacterized protein YndB with AHSA1/START domain
MTTVARTGVTTYETPTDTDFVITRAFAAPRRLVFDAHTDPKHIRQWMLGPEGWTMPVCEIDLRPGGAWRYVWRKPNESDLEMTGTVREVVPPERFVTTESWGPEWPETVNTTVFTESEGLTTVTLTMTYPTKKARDEARATGAEGGMDQSYARLDELLARLV